MGLPVYRIRDDEFVYRGLSNSNWCRNEAITYKAYLLRPATNNFPLETDLSVGLTPRDAIRDMHEQHGVAELSVSRVHALPHGLRVMSDPEDATKARLFGLPVYSVATEQIGLRMNVATDLAAISRFIPMPDPQ
jgi:hypothetical protein